MAKFAQYYSTYTKDNLFADLEWKNREDLLSEFLETEDCIRFSDKTLSNDATEETATDSNDNGSTSSPTVGSNKSPKKVKIYRHKVYHLVTQPKIVVMRIANVKVIPIEKDFKPDSVEHFPSLFVIFDLRDGCRRVAIQKLSTSFSTTDMVAKILQKSLGDAMMKKCHIGLQLMAQRYPMDFYKLWRAQQHHTARIKFYISRHAVENCQKMADKCITYDRQASDDSIVGHIYELEEVSRKSGYKSAIEIEAEEKGAVLYVDESSEYIRNLVTYSASTGTTIELITSDGASFECYIDSDFESDDKIVAREFESNYLEALFDADLDGEARKQSEEKVIEFVNSMKRVVDEDEKEVESA